MTQENTETPAANNPAPEPAGAPAVQPEAAKPPETPPENPAAGGKPENLPRDWEKDYNALLKAREIETRSYKELRSKLQAQGTEKNQFAKQNAELASQLKAVQAALSKLTEEPFNGDKFMQSLKEQGPKAIEDFLAKREAELSKGFEEKLGAVEQRAQLIETKSVIMDCRADAENFPDFQALEPRMAELYNAMVADFEAGLLQEHPAKANPTELVSHLYSLAKAENSQAAVQEAVKIGATKERERLARDARTAGVGGGKKSTLAPKDFSALSIEEMEKHFGVDMPR